ncbi:unnamed protein product [Prorocentrum cordatum]|uniref:Anaphase-promoting complex subunit 1 n=1 Tax=Prorocentrum cordatum TaxID=2364126 RepID=A0ABN9WVH0_9DINO|nr:unnamed protein product [Polarella glacialis]
MTMAWRRILRVRGWYVPPSGLTRGTTALDHEFGDHQMRVEDGVLMRTPRAEGPACPVAQESHGLGSTDAAELRTAASAPALMGPAPSVIGARALGGAPPGDDEQPSGHSHSPGPRPRTSRSASPEVGSPLPRAGARSRPRPPSVEDPTLVAMAGKHARHFVPERLPWQVLSRMTRVLQLCWGWSGLMALLKEVGIYQVDFQQHIGGERRRLSAAEPWTFEPLAVEWPLGSFFRPQALFCHPDGLGGLLVASPYALYAANGTAEGPQVWLREAGRAQIPASTALLCDWQAEGGAAALAAASACLLAAPAAGGVQMWRAGAAAAAEVPPPLPIDGAPWTLLAGASVPCAAVAALLPAREAAAGGRCALLAGWDGALLPVAVVPLPRGPGQPPPPGARVRPSVDAPLGGTDRPHDRGRLRWAARAPRAGASDGTPCPGGVAALTLEPLSGRLWAVLHSGDILAWDLFGASVVGRWRPAWPRGLAATGFVPAAVCEDPERGLLVLGRSTGLGAVLLFAESPWGPPLGVAGALEPSFAF